MNEEKRTGYVKRTQKDYTLSLKLQIVSMIERSECSVTEAQHKYGIQSRSTVVRWLRKYGNFDWEHKNPLQMPKSKDQRLMELEEQVKLLKKQKALLELRVEQKDKKAILFDMMINIAEKEYNIPIRKNCKPA